MVIGITGYIGAGKSTVMEYLKNKYGFKVLYEDIMADKLIYSSIMLRDMYRFAPMGVMSKLSELEMKRFIAKNSICALFDVDVSGEYGAISKEKVKAELSINPGVLDDMNKIIHPLVFDLLNLEIGMLEDRNLFAGGGADVPLNERVLFVESALPKEAGFYDVCDKIWCIRTKESDRINRVVNLRGMDKEKVAALNNLQSIDEKNDKMLFIDNDQGVQELEKKVDVLVGLLE